MFSSSYCRWTDFKRRGKLDKLMVLTAFNINLQHQVLIFWWCRDGDSSSVFVLQYRNFSEVFSCSRHSTPWLYHILGSSVWCAIACSSDTHNALSFLGKWDPVKVRQKQRSDYSLLFFNHQKKKPNDNLNLTLLSIKNIVPRCCNRQHVASLQHCGFRWLLR